MQMQLPVWIGDKLYNLLASKEIIEAYIAYFRHLQEMYLRTPTLFSVNSYRNNKYLLTSNRKIIFFYFYPLSYLQKNKAAKKSWIETLKHKSMWAPVASILQLQYNLFVCSGTAEICHTAKFSKQLPIS